MSRTAAKEIELEFAKVLAFSSLFVIEVVVARGADCAVDVSEHGTRPGYSVFDDLSKTI